MEDSESISWTADEENVLGGENSREEGLETLELGFGEGMRRSRKGGRRSWREAALWWWRKPWRLLERRAVAKTILRGGFLVGGLEVEPDARSAELALRLSLYR